MDWKHILPDLCRGRVESRFVPAERGLPVGASRFGGRPAVPAGFTWPAFETPVPGGETARPRPPGGRAPARRPSPPFSPGASCRTRRRSSRM